MSRFNSACIHLLLVALAIAGFTTVAKFFSDFRLGVQVKCALVCALVRGRSLERTWMDG
jgi:hypothetical protein